MSTRCCVTALLAATAAAARVFSTSNSSPPSRAGTRFSSAQFFDDLLQGAGIVLGGFEESVKSAQKLEDRPYAAQGHCQTDSCAGSVLWGSTPRSLISASCRAVRSAIRVSKSFSHASKRASSLSRFEARSLGAVRLVAISGVRREDHINFILYQRLDPIRHI